MNTTVWNHVIWALSLVLVAAHTGAYAADVKYLDVGVKEAFNISLASNPSTGYTWSATFDQAALALENDTYIRPTPDGGDGVSGRLIGAGGTQIFRFAALKPGTSDVTMNYSRPWEDGVAKTRHFLVRVGENNESLIDASSGVPFQISLEDGPASVGHLWLPGFDQSLLEMVNETYEPHLPDAADGGGWRTFEFLPLEPGEAEVSMTLESSAREVVRVWTFVVNVA